MIKEDHKFPQQGFYFFEAGVKICNKDVSSIGFSVLVQLIP